MFYIIKELLLKLNFSIFWILNKLQIVTSIIVIPIIICNPILIHWEIDFAFLSEVFVWEVCVLDGFEEASHDPEVCTYPMLHVEQTEFELLVHLMQFWTAQVLTDNVIFFLTVFAGDDITELM